MTHDIKIKITNLTKIFGPKAESVLKHVDNGMTKDDLLKEHQHVLGLSNINLDLANKNIEVIMGLSGSGKSTLIRHGANGTHTTATEASLASVDLDTVAADTRARVALGANATAAASSSPFARSQARATAIQCSAKINRIARFAIAKVTSVTRAGFRARSNNSAHSLRSAALGFAGINWLAFRAAPSIFFCHVCGGNRETIWAPAHAI